MSNMSGLCKKTVSKSFKTPARTGSGPAGGPKGGGMAEVPQRWGRHPESPASLCDDACSKIRENEMTKMMSLAGTTLEVMP